MKKLIVIALAVVMALSVMAFVACGPSGEVDGEYSYDNAWTAGQKYGCKVHVTVKNGTIVAITVDKDTDTFYNLSAGWTDKAKWENGGQAMIDSFVGLSVDEVNAIKVTYDTETNNEAHTVKGQPTKIEGAPAALKVVAGATQSSGRVILAVQNALSKLGK